MQFFYLGYDIFFSQFELFNIFYLYPIQEIDEMFKILAAVLSMGQIQFASTDDDFAVVQDSAQPIQSIQVWKFCLFDLLYMKG